ncbi:hypothetical protein [Massilia sp. YIM B02443]|uniref:hypothetical protein n=1 Tax=Massilia sp. YIM B02443 TaxID=3050127 RepID=UPI0025B64396|nr:hypothetical protein [Massilia sp. YIM B02443]MDN4036794.1 hypothetical protein [Massilia sp. YIM B02443]
MIDATQLPRLPKKTVADESEPVTPVAVDQAPQEQVKKMELKAGRYYAVTKEK